MAEKEPGQEGQGESVPGSEHHAVWRGKRNRKEAVMLKMQVRALAETWGTGEVGEGALAIFSVKLG